VEVTGVLDHAAAANRTSRGDRGILIWNDGNGSNPTAEGDLLGGTDLNIGGTIYSPKELVKVDGGGTAACNAAVQIIAWNYDVGGTSRLDSIRPERSPAFRQRGSRSVGLGLPGDGTNPGTAAISLEC